MISFSWNPPGQETHFSDRSRFCPSVLKMYSNLFKYSNIQKLQYSNIQIKFPGQETHFSDRSRFCPPPLKNRFKFENWQNIFKKHKNLKTLNFIFVRSHETQRNWLKFLNHLEYVELLWSIMDYWSHELNKYNDTQCTFMRFHQLEIQWTSDI